MKHGKAPTRRQKELIRSWGINPDNWLVVKDTPVEMVITHRYRDQPRTIPKTDEAMEPEPWDAGDGRADVGGERAGVGTGPYGDGYGEAGQNMAAGVSGHYEKSGESGRLDSRKIRSKAIAEMGAWLRWSAKGGGRHG